MVGFSQPDFGSRQKHSEIQDPAQLKSAASRSESAEPKRAPSSRPSGRRRPPAGQKVVIIEFFRYLPQANDSGIRQSSARAAMDRSRWPGG